MCIDYMRGTLRSRMVRGRMLEQWTLSDIALYFRDSDVILKLDEHFD